MNLWRRNGRRIFRDNPLEFKKERFEDSLQSLVVLDKDAEMANAQGIASK